MSLRVTILGTGYVGLVSGAGFASHGHDVTCVDLDPAKVAAVNAAESFLHEPGLAELLRENVPHRLRATADAAAAVCGSDVTILAVPTPFDAASGVINLSFVERAAAQVGNALRETTKFHVVIVKSTCVPGTADGLVTRTLETASGKRRGVGFGVASNPEFLSEGSAVDDFLRPDRIVYGGDGDRTRGVLAALHAGFDGVPVVATNNKTAELIKYASNALLATCVSFANELADVAEALGGVDVNDVSDGVSLSRYLSVGGERAPLASFLRAGCGYGGSCLPKDVAALVAQGKRLGLPMPMLAATAAINDGRAARLVDRIEQHLALEAATGSCDLTGRSQFRAGDANRLRPVRSQLPVADDAGPTFSGRRVAVLGTAFKPGTADLRTSPAVPIIDELVARGASITTFDPAANDATRRQLGDRVKVADSLQAAVGAADVIVVATAWPQFADLPSLLVGRDPQPLVADGRRMLRPTSVARYLGIGLETEEAR